MNILFGEQVWFCGYEQRSQCGWILRYVFYVFLKKIDDYEYLCNELYFVIGL